MMKDLSEYNDDTTMPYYIQDLIDSLDELEFLSKFIMYETMHVDRKELMKTIKKLKKHLQKNNLEKVFMDKEE